MSSHGIAEGRPSGGRLKLRRPSSLMGYLMIGPTMVLLVIFSYYPFFSSLFYSLTNWDGIQSVFIGLTNYKNVLANPEWWLSMGNVVFIWFFSVLRVLILPLLAAELLFNIRSIKAQNRYRALLITGGLAVPWMVIALLWQTFYHPGYGLFFQVFQALGIEHLAPQWEGTRWMALTKTMVMGFPWVGGLNTLIYLAGLQAIPNELFDAAKVDGVSGLFQRLFRIDLPLLLGQIKLLIILCTSGALQGYELIMIMTGGNPFRQSMVPGLLMYQKAFVYREFGYGAAIAVILFLLILAITYLNFKYIRSSTEYEASS